MQAQSLNVAHIVSCATSDPCNFGSTTKKVHSLLFTPAGHRSHSATRWLSVKRFVRFDPHCGPTCSAGHHCSWSDLTNQLHHERAISTKGPRNCPAGYVCNERGTSVSANWHTALVWVAQNQEVNSSPASSLSSSSTTTQMASDRDLC